MRVPPIPENLKTLQREEECVREEALALVAGDSHLRLHVHVTENTMNLADLLRQYPSCDADIMLVQGFGMRAFNAFAASLKLALCGYGQVSVLVMRDILETVFLLDLFSHDAGSIRRFRHPEERKRGERFRPVDVRKALEARDGERARWRATLYWRFSRYAAHPNVDSLRLLRPQLGADAQSGPFTAQRLLAAILSELGRCAVLAGDCLDRFLPETWADILAIRADCAGARRLWRKTFGSPDTV